MLSYARTNGTPGVDESQNMRLHRPVPCSNGMLDTGLVKGFALIRTALDAAVL